MTLRALIILNLLRFTVSYTNENNWFTSIARAEDLIAQFCYFSCPSRSFCTIKHQQLLANFTSRDIDSCKMFCWYAKNCHTFTYTLNASFCSLHAVEPEWDLLQIANNIPHFDTLSNMACWFNFESNPSVPCWSTQDLLEASSFSDGLLVQQLYTKLCLGIGQSGWPAWKDCASAPLWKFRELRDARVDYKDGLVNDTARLDDDPHTISVSVYLADYPDKCLSAVENPDQFNYKVVSFSECRTDSEAQKFDLRNGTIYFLEDSRRMITQREKRCYFQLISFQISYQQSLNTLNASTSDLGFSLLNILLPSEYQVVCVREELKVDGGVIEGTAPFFLPGSSISISCNPGLGFKEFNFSSSLNITCRDKMNEIPKCSNKSAGDKSAADKSAADKSAGDKSAADKSLIFTLLVFGGLVVSEPS